MKKVDSKLQTDQSNFRLTTCPVVGAPVLPRGNAQTLDELTIDRRICKALTSANQQMPRPLLKNYRLDQHLEGRSVRGYTITMNLPLEQVKELQIPSVLRDTVRESKLQ